VTNHTGEQSSAQRLFEQAAEFERVGDWRQADSSYAALFETGARAGDAGWVATAARRRAQVAFQRGEMDHAEELADLSKEIAVRCGMDEASARALNMLGMIQFNRNNHVRASETYAEAIVAARACGDDRTLIHASRNLGVVRENIGDLQGAKLHYLEGVAASLREMTQERPHQSMRTSGTSRLPQENSWNPNCITGEPLNWPNGQGMFMLRRQLRFLWRDRSLRWAIWIRLKHS
jgi:hypothetical protein